VIISLKNRPLDSLNIEVFYILVGSQSNQTTAECLTNSNDHIFFAPNVTSDILNGIFADLQTVLCR